MNSLPASSFDNPLSGSLRRGRRWLGALSHRLACSFAAECVLYVCGFRPASRSCWAVGCACGHGGRECIEHVTHKVSCTWLIDVVHIMEARPCGASQSVSGLSMTRRPEILAESASALPKALLRPLAQLQLAQLWKRERATRSRKREGEREREREEAERERRGRERGVPAGSASTSYVREEGNGRARDKGDTGRERRARERGLTRSSLPCQWDTSVPI